MFDSLPPFNPQNKQVFFFIEIGNEGDDQDKKERGEVVFELFSSRLDTTVQKFKKLCVGQDGYKGSCFHQVEEGKFIVGGHIGDKETF